MICSSVNLLRFIVPIPPLVIGLRPFLEEFWGSRSGGWRPRREQRRRRV